MKQNHRKQLSVLFLSLALLGGCAANNISTAEPNKETSAVTEENTAKEEVTQSVTGETYTATEADESAIDVSGNETLSLSNVTVEKMSGDATSANDASFKGVNSAVRVYDNATLTITGSTITADAENATGVFAYDNGTITISDSTITVTGGGAGGVQVAGGGTLYGNNLTVTSSSKAAIRSDRGGGIMVIDGGTYTSLGKNGCPAIYSTADITVSNATLTSENSRAVIIEGKNSVTLDNCILSGNDQSTKEGSVKANVLLYQSASGDAENGTSSFTMTNGSMTSLSGAMFYCTNTASVITLENTELNLTEDNILLIVSEGRWGKDGSNGGTCEMNVSDQALSGDITVDAISSLDLTLTNCDYTGAILSEGETTLTLSENSTWTLTADSYLTEINGDLTQIKFNGFTLYINGTPVTQ